MIRFPWLVVLVVLAITVFFAYNLKNIRIDNEISTFLPDDDPVKQFYYETEEIFGSGFMAVIGVFVEDNGPYKDVFDPAILTMIHDMTTELENSAITTKAKIQEKVKLPDGREIWKTVRFEEKEIGPDEVISVSTMGQLISRTIPPEFPDEQPEEELVVEDVLADPPSSLKDRNAAIAGKPHSYAGLPADMLFTRAEADNARRIMNSWDMYKNNLVGEDLKSTAIYITIPRVATIEYSTALNSFIEDMVEKYSRKNDGIVFRNAGLPLVSVLMGKYMHKDLRTLVPICFAVMILVLLISFKRFNGIFLPFLTVSLAVVWTVGFMAYLKVPLTILTSGLPTLIVAVGSAYTIHVIHYFYDQAKLGVPKREAIINTSTKIGIAVVMAGLTTIGGFISLVTSHVVPIREFGTFSAFGAFSSLVITMTLIFAILMIQPYPGGRKAAKKDKAESDNESYKFAKTTLLGRALFSLSIFVTKRPKLVGGISLIFLVICGYMTSLVVTDSNMVEYFKKDSPIRVSDTWLSERLGGTTTFSVIIDSMEENGFMKPDALNKLSNFQTMLQETFPDYVKKTMSLADYIKKINMSVGKEKPEEYRIPDTEAQVFDDLLLYESKPEVLDGIVDFDRQKVRVLVKCMVGGTRYMTEMKPVIENYIRTNMPGFEMNITGDLLMRWSVDQNLVRGQKLSIIISVIAVLLLLIIIFKSLTIGLICLGPILMSILGNFTIMALMGFPLDVGTCLIASMAVGIGVDYAIHYVNRYKIERARHDTIILAVQATHITSGKAIIFNALAVALGFMVLTGSQFIPLIRMGLLTAATMLIAAFTTLTTLPALLLIIRPYRKKIAKNDAVK